MDPINTIEPITIEPITIEPITIEPITIEPITIQGLQEQVRDQAQHLQAFRDIVEAYERYWEGRQETPKVFYDIRNQSHQAIKAHNLSPYRNAH